MFNLIHHFYYTGALHFFQLKYLKPPRKNGILIKHFKQEVNMAITTDFLNVTGNRAIGHNPLPTFYNQCERSGSFRVLPYPILNRYSDEAQSVHLPIITLENDYLRAQFLPENGGRLYSLYSKQQKRELLYKSPTLQPEDMSARNAYFPGGVSWNLTPDAHCPSSFEKVFFGKVDADAGYEFLRMYNYERTQGLLWQIDFHLSANSQELYAHVVIHNPHDFPTPIYWWANLDAAKMDDCRVFASGKSVALEESEEDISYPCNIDEEISLEFSCQESVTHPWIALAYAKGCGTFLRSSSKRHMQKATYGNDHFIELKSGGDADEPSGLILEAGESLSFTHAIGAVIFEEGDANLDSYHTSHAIIKAMVNHTLPTSKLEQQELYFEQFIKLPCAKMLSSGEGWGALENMRRVFDNQPLLSESLIFPTESFTTAQYDWLAILNKAPLADLTREQIPRAWVTDMNYLSHLQSYLAAFPNNVTALLFMGTIFYENRFAEQATQAWHLVLEKGALTIALRNLAYASRASGFITEALSYMEQIDWHNILNIDRAYLEEYFALLLDDEQYQKMINHYNRLPAKLQQCKPLNTLALNALECLSAN